MKEGVAFKRKLLRKTNTFEQAKKSEIDLGRLIVFGTNLARNTTSIRRFWVLFNYRNRAKIPLESGHFGDIF